MSDDTDIARNLEQNIEKQAHPARVLVVTAEPQLHQRVQAILAAPDWLVLPLLEEISSEEILDARADLILVDHAISSINVLLLIRELRLLGLNTPVIYNSTSGYSDVVCRRLEPIFLSDHIRTDQSNFEDLLPVAHRLCLKAKGSYNSPHLATFDNRNASGAIQSRRHRCRLGQSVDLETLALIAKLAGEYISEMPETLRQLQDSLTDLSLSDKDPDVLNNTLSQILNVVHQINGTGSSFGFIELGIVANLMERRLQRAIDSNCAGNKLALNEYLDYVALMTDMCTTLIASLSPDVVACLAAPVPQVVSPHVCEELFEEPFQRASEVQYRELAPQPPVIRRIALVAASDSREGQAIRTIINDQNKMSDAYQLIDAYNALSAFNLMEEFKPELLIIEARLPGLNGLEACKMIRSHPQWKEAKVLMLIDSQDKSDSVMQSGADDYLVTPTEVDSTVSKLKQLLAKKINRAEQVLTSNPWSID